MMTFKRSGHALGWLAAAAVFLSAIVTAHAADPMQTIDLGGGVKLELVLIQPGTFTQGSPVGEANRGSDETQRQVTISHPFYLAKTPVTRGQFAKFVAATGYKTESEKGTSGGFGLQNGELVQKPGYNWRSPGFAQTDDHPVVLVTWDDAEAFAKWLSGKTNHKFQLPTEAEWEFAIRAGTTTAFYNGDSDRDADRIAWHKGNSGDGTRPVGQKEANPWGLVDMAGNVWEWCRDWYGPYPTGDATDPLETRSNLSDKPRRVLRGGSFLKDAKNGRSAARFRSTPGTRNADTGFRISYDLPAPAKELAQPVETVRPPVTTSPQPQTATAPQPQPATLPQQRVPVQNSQSPVSNPPVATGVRSSLLAGILCPCVLLLVGGVVLIVIIAVWRGQKKSMQDDYPVGVQPDPVTQPPGPKSGPKPRRAPRIVADGFWLEDPIYTPGCVVRYSCRVGHTPNSGEFTVGPGHQGHFVYTGGTPSDVQILEVRPGAGGVRTDQPFDTFQSTSGPVIIGTSTPPPPPQTPAPPVHRAGFPPAY
ncbi:MAG: formylglycine-generating enzyme family protein [Planctomycetia bacterium]|nr:formylglycine-generating enzyme family protein [Planctomycetia bacterium]